MGDTPTISVVICCYTEARWDDLVAAVDSVRGQTLAPLQTIVVVDHNTALFGRIRTELPDVLALPNQGHRGLAGARNTGLAVATGEVVAFLDDDAVAARDWLEILIGGYRDPAVLGLGGWIEPNWLGGRPGWFPREFDWVVGCTYRGGPETASSVRNLIGANMSFRRELFEVVGGFVEGMGRVGTTPLGCEETELCLRAARQWPEGRFLIEPRARALHKVPEARGTWSYFRSRCYAEGISKARVTHLAGSQPALSAEKTYATRTLPRGVLRGLIDAVGGDRKGLSRAFAIVFGLAATSAGYLRGSLSRQHVDAPPLIAPLLDLSGGNGNAANPNASNGHDANGHAANGYAANGHAANGYGGHEARGAFMIAITHKGP